MRFLLYTLGDASLELPPPSPEKMAELGPFMAEASRTGTLLTTGGLSDRSQGVEVKNLGGSVAVTDGPFTEAKELVGGFVLIQAPSKAAAVDWATRLIAITGGEARVRAVLDPEGVGAG
jgi:hypothetical protein